MYAEPWSDIADYPSSHRSALEKEIRSEIGADHVLSGTDFRVIAKREDRDDVLVVLDSSYYEIHLTWSDTEEKAPCPTTTTYSDVQALKVKLEQDARDYAM